MKRTTNRVPEDTQVTLKRECLLLQVNSVSISDTPSFEGRQLAWEVSTLPLSYTRPYPAILIKIIASVKRGYYRVLT